MDANKDDQPEFYDYTQAGFDGFLTRSIDAAKGGGGGGGSRQVNFDQAQITGSLGNIFRIGSITLDGIKGQITITDSEGNTFFIAGELNA